MVKKHYLLSKFKYQIKSKNIFLLRSISMITRHPRLVSEFYSNHIYIHNTKRLRSFKYRLERLYYSRIILMMKIKGFFI